VGDAATLAGPSAALLALEARAWLEFASLIPALPVLQAAPRGDGHPVLVLPGWLASDTSTRALRWFLRDRGYHAHGWRLGRNHGPTSEIVSGLAARLGALRARHGRRISLVGWSLGGIYARELARRRPDDVRQVITLASPFRDPDATSALITRLAGRRPPRAPDVIERLRSPLPVPTTAIYSRTDGIVAWQCSVQEAGPQTENIEVEASHVGLGVNPAVLYAIADRLAQPEGQWQPFDRSGLRQLVYRDPAAADCLPNTRLV
jgi:pimeloyl-ACP methyl ester carboxylesterase